MIAGKCQQGKARHTENLLYKDRMGIPDEPPPTIQEEHPMAMFDDLQKVKRKKEFEEKEREQFQKIKKLRNEQKFKELEPMVRDALDALGMATWGCDEGERNYHITPDKESMSFKLYSGPYEYSLRIIADEEGTYFEMGVMGNLARSLDTSKKSLEHIIKTIYKRGPDYQGSIGDKKRKR